MENIRYGRLWFLMLSIIPMCGLSAQVDVKERDGDFLIYSQVRKTTTRVMDKERYKGPIYLHDQWQEATFHHTDYDDVTVDSVRFNIFRGEVEIYRDGEHLTLDNRQFDSFDFTRSHGVVKPVFKTKHYFFDNDQRLPGIIKVAQIEDYAVIVAYIASVRNDSDKNPLMMESLKKDKVVLHKHRYIEKDGVLSRIKSKKDFKKFFKPYPDVLKYISSEKLNHKDEEDIAKAVMRAFGSS